eukprot:CAMPEP_0117896198 /NCGR_PEP_ID=MMETSP0950-20121206/27112_1 /TAXON_ID=44440 /ORGANISM="Chattonella subsalsa, Strain CCMP2191" /LENGTH=139 /DNA_ID=CAMNT_0005757269 /DNA_START=226 /DNA_END=645 /DNA_ORIENTATION=+
MELEMLEDSFRDEFGTLNMRDQPPLSIQDSFASFNPRSMIQQEPVDGPDDSVLLATQAFEKDFEFSRQSKVPETQRDISENALSTNQVSHQQHVDARQSNNNFNLIDEISVKQGEVDLMYDPVLNCYYDPKSDKYYELK